MENIKLICFDMDDTLIKQNSWYELGMALGITPEEDKDMVAQNTLGQLPYIDWIKRLENLFKERGEASKENVTRSLFNYEYNAGAKQIVQDLHKKGYKIAIISGSFDILVSRVAKDLNVDFFKGNTSITFDSQNMLEELLTYGDEAESKLKHLLDFCKILDIDISECACVGDGANDIEMFRATGHGVTFENSPITQEAWKVVKFLKDLNSIF